MRIQGKDGHLLAEETGLRELSPAIPLSWTSSISNKGKINCQSGHALCGALFGMLVTQSTGSVSDHRPLGVHSKHFT